MIKKQLEKLDFVTPKELAIRFRVSEKFLQKQRSTNRGIPYIKIGSKVFYAEQDISAWLDAQKLKK